MPSRIIRDAILTSEAVCSLGWADEVFYRRLMSIVDDYGRHEASPQLLRSRCYPLQTDAVRVADISRSMAACQSAGLIVLYESNGKQYLELQKFGQQTRSNSKHPAPSESACKHLIAIDSKCLQPITDAHLVGVGVVVDKEPTVLVDDKSSTPIATTSSDRLDCPYERIAEAWNEIAVSLAAVKKPNEWAASRKAATRARWAEKLKLGKYDSTEKGVMYWRRIFAFVEASDFLSGRTGAGNKWRSDFDWVMNPTNLGKIVEGKYVNEEEAVAA